MIKKAHGFTIVELLIVIVVIAILAAISIVAYRGIQDRATVTTLQSDLRNAATQLGVAKATDGTYPSPSLPSTIKSSSGTTLSYTSNGDTYCLTAISDRSGISAYNISSTGSISQGACSGHMSATLTCPSGFISVPGNSHYGTSDFCVMKYEAKNVSSVATSQAAGNPWANITQASARSAAQNACEGCRLITEPEWMTIAMNAILVPSNWTGSAVGSGYMYRGHSDNAPANSLAASSDDNDGYSGTGNSDPSVQRRTLTLTNGEVIWDFAGNLWEWTDATITGGQPGLAGQTGYTVKDYNDNNLQWNSLAVTSRPTGTLYSRSQGVGGINSSITDTNVRGFLRGGYWYENTLAGVLALYFPSPSTAHAGFGFRATK